MNRRRYLLGLAGAVATAGCVGAPVADRGRPDDPPGDRPPADRDRRSGSAGTSPPAGPPSGGRPGFEDVELPVDRSKLVRGAPRDAIPAIVDPAFAPDYADVDRRLDDDELVIGLARDGQARAYPLSVLATHEVVNDSFGDPVVVTYCPLCASGVTARRVVDGRPSTFGVSGYLFRSNLVMYDDRTDSLWSQIMATAIRGEATGQTLTLVPSTTTTWAAWSSEHPDTAVLLPPPASETVPEPYDPGTEVGYGGRGHVGLPAVGGDFEDDRLAPYARVIGVATEGAARAYPREAVVEAGAVNDRVGGLPVVVTAAPTLQAYDRRVGDRTLAFEAVGDRRLRGGGSVWNAATGRALSGPHEGRYLRRANGATPMYWFAWLDFHPGTTVWRGR